MAEWGTISIKDGTTDTWRILDSGDYQISWKVKFDPGLFKQFMIGTTWDTYKITYPQPDPEVRAPKIILREGSYFPEQLGLYLEDVVAIHIGFCGLMPGSGIDGLANSNDMIPLGHAHPVENHICFRDGSYIFAAEGVVDDVFIHEYCHILRGCEDCDFEKTNGHDERWKDLMITYGLPPEPYCPYVYK